MNTSIAAIALLAATCSSASASAQAIALSEIEARLFLAHSGGWSEPLTEGQGLWNTVIGEGGAVEPSTSTLVKVAVVGPPNSFDRNASVFLAVTSLKSKATVLRSRQHLGVFSQSGRQYVAFWLPNTGCEPLRLSASISGSSQKVARTIPFACGE